MRLAVVGAGAIGATYGALLARAGHAVTLVDVDPAQVEAISRDGVVLLAPAGGVEHVAVPITADASAVGDAEAVLVVTKAYATAAVARGLERVLEPDAIVVTLQNGLGNDRALAAVLGERVVVAGSTTVGAQLRGPGVVAASPGTLEGTSLTSLQAPADAGPRATAQRLADALGSAGLPAELLADVGAVVWRKLALAAPIGPLCAVLRCSVADVLARPAATRLLAAQFAEVLAVAAAEGVALEHDELWAHALATFGRIGDHPPSIAVDVAAGRPTELEAQLGEVQRRGRTAGVRTPAVDVVADLVRAVTDPPTQGPA